VSRTHPALSTNRPIADSARAIGILGGTFDPLHFGHLQVAREILERLRLSEVRLVPAFQSPHRDRPVASASQRLAMAGLAIQDCPGLSIDDREIRRGGLSYSFMTVSELRRELPARGLLLVVGMDQFLKFELWNRWSEIPDLCHLAIVSRPGLVMSEWPDWAARRRTNDLESIHDHPSGRIVSLEISPLDISATRIRERITAGTSVAGLLPGAVIDYIRVNHIYSPGGRHT